MIIVNAKGYKMSIPDTLKDNFIGKGWTEVEAKKTKKDKEK